MIVHHNEPCPAILHFGNLIALDSALSLIAWFIILSLGPPCSLVNLTQNLMKIQWTAVAMADHYIISVSPLINGNESESTFVTSNTTIHLPLQHSQDYNVRVMAGNCAGNSTPVEISMRVGKT